MPDQLPLKLDLARVLLDEPAIESVSLQAPSGAAAAKDLGTATAFIRAWEVWSPAEDVEWAERNWAAAGLGRQRVPVRVRVGSWDRVADLTGKAAELNLARTRFASLVALAPGPKDGPEDEPDGAPDEFRQAAAKSHKSWMGLDDDDFARLLAVLPWFVANPLSGLRSRAVPVEGVDTKWIERHRRLLLRLLKPLGMDDLGLAPKRAMVRVRFLDPALAPTPELLDIAVPYDVDPTRGTTGLTVVVVENLETFLALPQTSVGSKTILVWGAGYSGAALAQLPWVRAATVLYWGDADVDGYAILNALRTHMPAGAVRSVCMDAETVTRYKHLAVDDPSDPGRVLPHLTADEDRARRLLTTEGNLRLEQERISLQWALSQPPFADVWDLGVDGLRPTGGTRQSG